MQQYWLLERTPEDPEDKIRYLYFCNASGRETAKQMASRSLLGNPDHYIVTPVTEPGQVVKLGINIHAT